LDTFQATNTTVDIAEFKDRFSEMLTLVEQGGQVIDCRRNVPLARIEAIRKPVVRPPKASVAGCMKGSVRIHADLAEPCIPDSEWDILSLPQPIHRDPADRIQIATARTERLTLVTTDGRIRRYPHVTSID
jgi:antitoxin (DNA-binding transcriptional repressor) of toxin-antitoxin stability system